LGLGTRAATDPVSAETSSSAGSGATEEEPVNQGEPGALPPWADSVASRWANASRAVVLTDMSQCQPASALSSKPKRHHWRIVPYEAGGLKGNMIWAFPETAAPVVKLPLGVKGWHAIFVGLQNSEGEDLPKVWLKLDGEPAPQLREVSGRGIGIEEIYFKVADLQGGNLHIAQQPAGFPAPAALVYVKLIPLAEGEVAGLLADRKETSNRKLAVTSDGFSFIFSRQPTTVEELLAEVEMYRDTDFDTLLLHLGGADWVSYPSKVGTMMGQDMDDFPRVGDRYYADAVRQLAKKGINPNKVLIDGAHAIGMKVHIGVRPAGWSFWEPISTMFRSNFYEQHPEWRCVDRDCTPVARMSWAVPEVRKHMVDLLREAMGFGADGAHLAFVRGYPLVLYETPFLDIFQKKHGEDPRKLDEEADPRIRQAWSDVVTAFMREARAMLDQEAVRRGNGKRLALSAMVLGNEYDNMQYGADVRRWVSEGLVDELFSYKWDFGAKKRTNDVKSFTEMCEAKGIPFRPSFTVEPVSIADSVDDAASWYKQGVQGLTFFDGVSSGQMIKYGRFGHIAELPLHRGKERPKPVQMRFHILGDKVLDGRFPPYWGG